MGWSGFVVRPFGVRKVVPTTGAPYQVDYERVQRELIDPAMRAAGIAGARRLHRGVVHVARHGRRVQRQLGEVARGRR